MEALLVLDGRYLTDEVQSAGSFLITGQTKTLKDSWARRESVYRAFLLRHNNISRRRSFTGSLLAVQSAYHEAQLREAAAFVGFLFDAISLDVRKVSHSELNSRLWTKKARVEVTADEYLLRDIFQPRFTERSKLKFNSYGQLSKLHRW